MEILGQQVVWYFGCIVFGENEKLVFGYWCMEWGVIGLLVGQEFGQGVWIYDGVGENMGVDFGVFFDQVDVDFCVFFCCQLFQLDC